jgi:periplasmic protein TonB
MSSVTLPSPVMRRRRDDSWWIFAVTLVVSVGFHFFAFKSLQQVERHEVKNEPIAVEIVQIEPPKPPPPPPPEEEKPKPPPPKLKPPPIKTAEVKPPPTPEPPPPNEEAKEPPKEPPPLVVGVTMSSTSTAGAFAAPVGNTNYGKMEKTAVDPSTVKPYWAPKYVPPGSADRDPVLEVDCKTDYPEEAKKNDVEGTVRMRITVDDAGKVVEVKQAGPAIGFGLDEAARRAILRCKFKPAIKAGEPVATSFVYADTFQLD